MKYIPKTVLKNISSAISTSNNKVFSTKQNINDTNDNYSVAKAKEISFTFKTYLKIEFFPSER